MTTGAFQINASPQVLQLLNQALNLVESKYGPNSPHPLAYHNAQHTLDITHAVNELADLALSRKLIEEQHKPLLLIAAAFHDAEHSPGNSQNEAMSAQLAVHAMRQAGGFSAADEKIVTNAIMGTVVYFKNDVMKQSAGNDYLVQLVADADLATLGRPTPQYWRRANCFFEERNPGASRQGPVWADFVTGQASFLGNHQFYTTEANELFPHKTANIAYIKALLITL